MHSLGLRFPLPYTLFIRTETLHTFASSPAGVIADLDIPAATAARGGRQETEIAVRAGFRVRPGAGVLVLAELEQVIHCLMKNLAVLIGEMREIRGFVEKPDVTRVRRGYKRTPCQYGPYCNVRFHRLASIAICSYRYI